MSQTLSAENQLSQRLTFKNQRGEVLTGDLYLPSEKPAAGVVFGHCFTCSRHTRILIDSCQELVRADIAAFRFDFSGNGQSEGQFAETTYSKHIDEMKRAMKLLKTYGVDKIGLAGHSMGAAISLLTAASETEVSAVCTLAGRYSKLDVSGLLDESARAELEQTGQMSFVSRGRTLSLTREFFNDVSSYDFPHSVAEMSQPLLAIHGNKDEIIPVEEVYYSRQFKPDNTELVIIEDADHMFSQAEHRRQIARHLAVWFKKHLASKPIKD